MKKILFSLILLIIGFVKVNAQDYTCNYHNEENFAPWGASENGYAHSPNGNLHMMLLFVTFNEDDTAAGTDNLSAIWPKMDCLLMPPATPICLLIHIAIKT